MNEAETRAEHIDPALKTAGWGVVPAAAFGANIRSRSVASKVTGGAANRFPPITCWNTATQARRHRSQSLGSRPDRRRRAGQRLRGQAASAVHLRHQRPGHLRHRHGRGQGRRAAALPYAGRVVADDLCRRKTTGATGSRRFHLKIAADIFQGRYYQDIAVERVLEAIADNRERILLTLATGTGKTFIAFQIAWKLFHSRWNLSREATRRPRILFLADRNILANQAYNAFSAFPEDALVRIEPDDIRKKGRVPKNGSLFFTIFQTFMSGPPIEGKPSPYFGDYPPDFFDFIVIDECHRGGANDESNWRDILEYFAPAVQLGLTATPKRKDNVDTYAYFGEPVLRLFAEGRHQRRLPDAVQGQADFDHAGRIRLHAGRPLIEGEIETGQALCRKRFQPRHRDPRTRKEARPDFHGADQPEGKDAGLLRHPGPRAGGARLINQMKPAKTRTTATGSRPTTAR